MVTHHPPHRCAQPAAYSKWSVLLEFNLSSYPEESRDPYAVRYPPKPTSLRPHPPPVPNTHTPTHRAVIRSYLEEGEAILPLLVVLAILSPSRRGGALVSKEVAVLADRR